jgi:hypothetical protein
MYTNYRALKQFTSFKQVRFEALTVVTMKNVTLWDVALCRSCDFSTLKMEAIRSEMSVHARSTQHHIPEDDILQVSNKIGKGVLHTVVCRITATFLEVC